MARKPSLFVEVVVDVVAPAVVSVVGERTHPAKRNDRPNPNINKKIFFFVIASPLPK